MRWDCGRGEGKMGGEANRPKLICPFNFFKVGGITMHSCISYVPDKLNIYNYLII